MAPLLLPPLPPPPPRPLPPCLPLSMGQQLVLLLGVVVQRDRTHSFDQPLPQQEEELGEQQEGGRVVAAAVQAAGARH